MCMKHAQITIGVCLSLCVVLVTGCATPAKPTAMVAHNLPQAGVQHGPVTVLVTGGHETDPTYTTKISDADFRTALAESLRKAGIFQPVETGGSAPYCLKVRLEYLDQPMMGFDMTVSLRADWTLTQVPGDRVLWHDRIGSSYTATVGQAFSGATRLRKATEGAARQNIELGLAQLAQLKLDP